MLAVAAFVVFLFSARVQAQSPIYGQCGGVYWTGPTTCVAGTICVYSNPYYSQCLAGTTTTTSTSTSTTTTTTTSSTSTTTTTSSSSSSTSTTSTSSSSSTTSTPTSCPAIPASLSYTDAKLPDPFKFVGTGARTATKADFACRQKEIGQLFQTYELGTLPPAPANVSGSISGNTLTVKVSVNGQSISFNVAITYPSGNGPFPAIIALTGAYVPIPAGIATLTVNTDDIAKQDSSASRGLGNFYTLYGSGHSAGALIAWAWGVGRIIDVLQQLGPTATKIDTKKLGVTGCSRWGKGAFVVGAFEPRIVLTIPQESGSGGAACWRLSDWQQTQGQNVQTLGEIIGENVWFSTALNAFSGKTTTLSVDHHLLAALTAPRGLFVIENTSMEWLGAQSTNGCMITGHLIYTALGLGDTMGFSQVGNHDHCAFPSSQTGQLDAYINKFLLGQSTNTSILTTDGTFTFNQSQWIDWTVPTLT